MDKASADETIMLKSKYVVMLNVKIINSQTIEFISV